MMTTKNKVVILGTRGIPASYGGFETFAEKLALHLVDRGWDVTVYCQSDHDKPDEQWNRIGLVHRTGWLRGAVSTIIFDWRSLWHALRYRGDAVFLTLGYNTGIFNLLPKILGKAQAINMDGLEWMRSKWGWWAKSFFRINYHVAGRAANVMIADHPEIARILGRDFGSRNIHTIAYGGVPPENPVPPQWPDYALVIARPEPENNLLQIVRAWSIRKRNRHLVVLGNYHPTINGYHQRVMQAASDEVVFVGAIHDPQAVTSLRHFARVYVHGHSVGGTNPSLVEALACGNAVIAHDNVFNRYVAGQAGQYFSNTDQLAALFDRLDDLPIADMKKAATARFTQEYQWLPILQAYETLLLSLLARAESAEKTP